MPALSREQRDAFWLDGYLMVENVVDADRLLGLRRDFDGWVEESRGHSAPYGEIIDGRPRFDVEPGHTSEKPALRRVNSPVEVSQAYYDCMADSPMTEMVADLVGPNVKFHHCKINSKLPGAKTAVKWHQDFPFTPHSNDDIVTALLFVDEVTEDNGPLEVVGGTHRGPIHSLWHDGKFTAAVGEEIAEASQRKALRCMGPAGSCCFMHTRLLHGSAPNRLGTAAHAFHHRLHRRRCSALLRQPCAQQIRRTRRARRQDQHGSLDRLCDGSAAEARLGLVLRAASQAGEAARLRLLNYWI